MKINQQIKILPRTFLIREFLRKEHLTQKQFALMCGVSQSYVSRVLAGKTRYFTAKLDKVLKTANLDFTYYFDVEFLF